MTELLKPQPQVGHPLIHGFVRSVRRFPSRTALEVGGASFTYESLGQIAGDIAATILDADPGANPLVAILAHRSLTAYAGVLGAHSAGKGYVPLKPKLPVERLSKMLIQSGSECVIVGEEALSILQGLLDTATKPLTILLPDAVDAGKFTVACPRHRFIAASKKLNPMPMPAAQDVDPDAVSHLLFTSGSTGDPKGVPVSQQNVTSYVSHVCERYGVRETDRFSQMFDMTFDLSVHDLFVCWERGACLCVVPEKSVMAPAKFIKDHELTMWFSVPSVIGFMAKMGMLKPGIFSSLRVSLFCGEPLPAAYAEAWQEAAPDSVIENLYGPTETTIAITGYRWDPIASPSACINGIVPIGWVFDHQDTCVIDQERNPVPTGERGELCLSGAQVTRGYWNNPARTAEQFIRLPASNGDDRVWYRTGDLVKQDESGCLYYLGRLDHQVKIRGYRVELQEIDFVLRKVSETEQVASVAWPVRNGIAEGVVAFICGACENNRPRILAHCRDVLPEYMVPRQLYFLDDWPLNSNGKTDRKKLVNLLETQGS